MPATSSPFFRTFFKSRVANNASFRTLGAPDKRAARSMQDELSVQRSVSPGPPSFAFFGILDAFLEAVPELQINHANDCASYGSGRLCVQSSYSKMLIPPEFGRRLSHPPYM